MQSGPVDSKPHRGGAGAGTLWIGTVDHPVEEQRRRRRQEAPLEGSRQRWKPQSSLVAAALVQRLARRGATAAAAVAAVVAASGVGTGADRLPEAGPLSMGFCGLLEAVVPARARSGIVRQSGNRRFGSDAGRVVGALGVERPFQPTPLGHCVLPEIVSLEPESSRRRRP